MILPGSQPRSSPGNLITKEWKEKLDLKDDREFCSYCRPMRIRLALLALRTP